MRVLDALTGNLWRSGLVVALVACLGLVAALLATRGTLSEVKRERDTARVELSVSNASVDRLQSALERIGAEQQALAEGDAGRIQASRQTLELAEAAGKVRQVAIDRLRASAAAGEPDIAAPVCEVSAAVADAWQ